MKYNIQLPFFPGFYESLIDPRYLQDNYFDGYESKKQYIEKYGIDFSPDDIEVDYDSYTKDVCKLFVDNFKEDNPDWITSMEFQEMTSPAYYNFETDKIFVDIEVVDNYKEHLLNFLNKYYNKSKEYIKKYHSSRDGYISFMDNDIELWIEDIKNNDKVDERNLSEILKMYILFEVLPGNRDIYSLREYEIWEESQDLFLYGIWENIYIPDYFYYDKKNYINREEVIKDNKELLSRYDLTVSCC